MSLIRPPAQRLAFMPLPSRAFADLADRRGDGANQSSRRKLQSNFVIEILGQATFNEARTKTSSLRRLHRRSAAFGPSEREGRRLGCYSPVQLHAARTIQEGAVFAALITSSCNAIENAKAALGNRWMLGPAT
jgi:hypothetical protein